jgi:hypothetical protein
MSEIKSNTAHKVIAAMVCLVSIPAYIAGCVVLALWSMRHMWTQTIGYVECIHGHLPKGTKWCRCWYDPVINHWGTALVIALEVGFAIAVVCIAMANND